MIQFSSEQIQNILNAAGGMPNPKQKDDLTKYLNSIANDFNNQQQYHKEATSSLGRGRSWSAFELIYGDIVTPPSPSGATCARYCREPTDCLSLLRGQAGGNKRKGASITVGETLQHAAIRFARSSAVLDVDRDRAGLFHHRRRERRTAEALPAELGRRAEPG